MPANKWSFVFFMPCTAAFASCVNTRKSAYFNQKADTAYPDTLTILDFIEFVAASIGKPIEGQYHSYYRHHHLSFDRENGLRELVESINSIFARNGEVLQSTKVIGRPSFFAA